jgi:hypothetical protein
MEEASSHILPRLSAPSSTSRAVYEPPRLEALGPWRALTLQQSIPLGPAPMIRRPD